jgi:hypothetical protein
MNRALVRPIADAVLYEGYVLYPYRPSAKNRQRWTFGGLLPPSFCQTHPGERSVQQTECLVEGNSMTIVEAVVRFLHVVERQIGAIDRPAGQWTLGTEPPFRPVDWLSVGGHTYVSWQEAREREAAIDPTAIESICATPRIERFTFRGGRSWEPITDSDNSLAGVLIREQQDVEAVIELAATEVAGGLYRLTLRTGNRSAMPDSAAMSREKASPWALVSTHAILGVQHGAFVSLMDPPDPWRTAAASCQNIGTWPVLVGDEEQRDTMLSSPIILYDYPRVAPESPGDFFDGTEIDEMLTLRIQTLTEAEKALMAAVDERARSLLVRTEAMPTEQLMSLHGTRREPGPSALGGSP